MKTAHWKVFFEGRVQGVGFRYTVRQLARGYEVAGFVRNLPDGRVELQAEGAEAEIKDFVRAIEQEMEGYIQRTETIEETQRSHFKDFLIR